MHKEGVLKIPTRFAVSPDFDRLISTAGNCIERKRQVQWILVGVC
jgi:hypothetical protein